ncbi:MAG TPA: outer membrane lipoprotein-sorting protein [Verrucomicrobiae bacterium]|nr:outer membrane lipoprotein-sorting protein [Verrucomicrobiae bacterium]
MRIFLAIGFAVLVPSLALADSATTNQTAQAILERVLANRPQKDFSLKARLFVGDADPVPVEILVENTPGETRTLYRGSNTEALIVQPVHGEPRFYLRGVGELTGNQRTRSLLGSNFTYYDLGLAFLRWPNPKLLEGEDRVRGRDCFAIETRADGQPYARVKLWIDKEYYALLKAEAFDANDNLVRRFAVTSFKRIADVWVPRGMEAARVPPAQSLPSEEKSRLEVYEGDYGTHLPAEWFATERFGPEQSVGNKTK